MSVGGEGNTFDAIKKHVGGDAAFSYCAAEFMPSIFDSHYFHAYGLLLRSVFDMQTWHVGIYLISACWIRIWSDD